ncbi:DUF4838 domain-containing protein [Candidatus Latescibacterota bacterium]
MKYNSQRIFKVRKYISKILTYTDYLVLFITILIVISGCTTMQKEKEILLIRNERSKHRIVIAENASPSTIHGAMELQSHLYKMTGAELPIVTDTMPLRKNEIIIGNNSHLEQIGVDIDFESLGDEGYILKTVGSYIIIAGGDLRGNMYGVYGLLEDHLGFRWFTADVSHIPKTNRLVIPVLNEVVVPKIAYREPYVWEAFDGDWAARNRMNRNSKDGGLGFLHGGKIEWVTDMFVHTFEKLVPPDEYFRAHPEYFSLVGGRRQRNRSQLCSTNEDVIKIVTKGVLQAFREHPEAYVISVSQNDWDAHCECKKCQALAEEEGSQIAPVLRMVNLVAEEVEKEFPGRLVETLAYQWTRKSPKNMRPRQNVVIRLCTIECCFSHPLNSCGSIENIEFSRDLREWGAIADRLWIWNYVTSFAHYFAPFPNLRVRDDNIRFFTENNVTGIFQQDVYTTPHGELSGLSAYVNAKLLWNPYYDEDTAINEFLEGVYGPAARPIREYIDIIHDEVDKKNIHMGIWQGTDAEYMNDTILAVSDSLWNDAEHTASHLPEVLRRVKIARLSVDYAIIARARANGTAYIINQEKSSLEINPSFSERVERFCSIAENTGVLKLKEYGFTIGEFRDEIEKNVRPRQLVPVAKKTSNGQNPGVTYKYYKGSYRNLPNFNTIKPRKSGAIENFILPFEVAGDTLGFVFDSSITIFEDGIYTFFIRSDGYTDMSIGSSTVLVNNGTDDLRDRCGFVALEKGSYPIKLIFFTKTGGNMLNVHYSGPGISKRRIPSSSLRN